MKNKGKREIGMRGTRNMEIKENKEEIKI